MKSYVSVLLLGEATKATERIMSQMESRLPMFSTKPPSYFKDTKSDTNYIIPLDGETKLSDYNPDISLRQSNGSAQSPSNKSLLKTPTTVSKIGKPPQKPSSLPGKLSTSAHCFYSPDHEKIVQPSVNLNNNKLQKTPSPSSTAKNMGQTTPTSTGQTTPKSTGPSKISRPSVSPGKATAQALTKSPAVKSKPPATAPKPASPSGKAVTASSTKLTSQLTKSTPSLIKPVESPTNAVVRSTKPAISTTKALTKSAGSLQKPSQTNKSASPSENLKSKLRRPAGKTLTVSKSEARLSVPSNITMSTKRRSSQEMVTPNLSRSLESNVPTKMTSAKSESKLNSPSQIKSGLRRPLTFRKSLQFPKTKLKSAETETDSVEMESTLAYSPLSQVLRLAEDSEYSTAGPVLCSYQFQCPVISQSVVSESVTNLYTCDIIFPLQQSQAISKLELVVFETAKVDIIRSFSAPEFNFPNDLYHAKPFMAHVQPTQCFTYLQRAEPSSYKKRLVNSFAISEQLSPTAKTQAQHIADSLSLGVTHEGRVEVMPQPWLSADLLDDNTPEGISLMIPEPLTPCRGVQSSLHSITEADETQIMMDEDSTMSRKKRPCKKAASFSLTQGIAREKVDELITQYNRDISSPQVSQGKPSAGLFSNLLSKIGGRRILSRPQESPPRARRSLSNPSPSSDRPAFVRGSTVIQRRKSSPSIRTRESQARNRLAKFIITISNAHSSKRDSYCKLSFPAHWVHNSQLIYFPSLFWRKLSPKNLKKRLLANESDARLLCNHC